MMAAERVIEYVDDIPGSLVLIDESEKYHSEGTLHARGRDSDIILNPQPSNDVNDPLNWTKGRKLRTLVATLCYTFALGFCSSTVFSGFNEITATRGISLTTLTQGTGYLYGFYGGGIFIVPLALKFGHRPIYLISLIIALGMIIWTPFVTTSGQWIASRIIYGFFGTPVENLNECTIALLYFTHERGFYIGIYAFVLYFGAFLAPICSGFLFDRAGLDGVSWFTAAVCALIILIVFFCFEEVAYNRRAPVHVVNAPATQAGHDTLDSEKTKNGAAVGVNFTASDASNAGAADESTANRRLEGKPHSIVYRLGMFRDTYCTNRQMLTAVWRPVWLVFRFPVIFYAGFSYGCSLSIFTIFTGTIGLVMGSEPYNFSSAATGLVYIAPLLASCVSGPAVGFVGDKLAIKWARGNKGIREPEHRLIISVFLLLIVPWGFVQWGVGAVHGIHWFGLVFALGLIGVYATIQAALSIQYALDAYRDLAGEVLVSVILVRNTLSFAIGYAVVPLIDNLGVQNAYLCLGFSAVGFVLLFVPMMMFGKRMRAESKDLYWSYVSSSAFAH